MGKRLNFKKHIDTLKSMQRSVERWVNERGIIKLNKEDHYFDKWFSYISFTYSAKQEYINEYNNFLDKIVMMKKPTWIKNRVGYSFNRQKSFPSGEIKKGDIMIIGMAPSKSYKSMKEGYLKSTLEFSKYSIALKNLIYVLIEKYNCNYPYVTNLCKYATPDNKVKEQDYDYNYELFKIELNILEPKLIVVLGRDVFDYLKRKKVSSLVYRRHPSYFIYNHGYDKYIEEFITEFLKDLNMEIYLWD